MYYLEKIHNLKDLIQSCNFNIIDVLKLKDIYSIIIWQSLTEDHRITKNVQQKLLFPPGKCFPQIIASPLWEQNCHSLQGGVFEKFVFPLTSRKRGKDTVNLPGFSFFICLFFLFISFFIYLFVIGWQ